MIVKIPATIKLTMYYQCDNKTFSHGHFGLYETLQQLKERWHDWWWDKSWSCFAKPTLHSV